MTQRDDMSLQSESVEPVATRDTQCVSKSDSHNEHGRRSATSMGGGDAPSDDWAEIYQNAPVPLLTLSASGVIINVNRSACELLALPEATLRGALFLRLFCAQDRANIQERMWSASIATAERFETQLVLPSDELVPVQVWIRGSAATSGGHHVTLLDLRERDRLILAERNARAASDAKDQFIAMLSHELRTPLTPVLAAASRLRRDPGLGTEARDLLEMIQRNVTAEARMIDDLLDATGILRGQLHVLRQVLELNGLLLECIDALQEQALEKGVSVDFTPAFGEYFTIGDASRLRQVFRNLLHNAVKFTPEGGKVELRSQCGDGRLSIELRDSGVGFDPAETPRLFAAFEQLDRGRVANGGLGLGLSISKGIIELHGGTISATSQGPGLGSRFVIELPILDAPESATSASKPECREVSEITTVEHKQILLVEDHADTAEIMTMLFEEQGFTVLAFDSIQAALGANLDGIDVLVSDIGLPDGTGMDLVQQIRHLRDIPAIALSGYGMESDVENALQAGFDLHFTKPVDFERLLTAIHSLLESRALPRSVQAVQ